MGNLLADSPHTPVLLQEIVGGFGDLGSGVFIDCTLGYAGHSRAVLEANSRVSLIGIDRDMEAINFSKEALKDFGDRVELIHGAFSEVLGRVLEQNKGKIVGILADFGVSSLQLDKKERGFAFDSENLDMRMDKTQQKDAKFVLNHYSQKELERVFREYGELREARALSSAILKYRAKKKITTADNFGKIIKKIVKDKRKNPLTLPFQAIRIEVNDELGEIARFLEILKEAKPSGAKVGIITFHSLEDRAVKQAFREWSNSCRCPAGVLRCSCGNSWDLGRELNRKPLTASAEELKQNPRSRSAKVRFFQFKEES